MIILIEVGLGVAFITLMVPENEHFQVAGVLEWIIALLGTIYLWLFVGFLDGKSARIVLK